MITVIGLGKNNFDITTAAKKAIKQADIVAVRSFKIPVLARLKKSGAVSMDEQFDNAGDFSDLDKKIIKRLYELEQNNNNVVYCVDGDGYSDSVVTLLSNKRKINIIQGVSNFGARKPSGGILSLDAFTLLFKKPMLDTSLSLAVTGIDSSLLASDVKLYLLDYYLPEQSVFIQSRKNEQEIKLYELDRVKGYNADFCVFIPECEGYDKGMYGFSDLVRVVARLTSPNGCSWDIAQTHESIRVNLIEEAYEAVDAIDKGDIDAMIEETGDVLLQSVFHADIAQRSGEYSINQVIDNLCKKLISRHTHIFGSDIAINSNEALQFWEQAKTKEKSYLTLSDKLNSVPNVFPATLKAAKVLSKARKDGLGLDYQQIFNAANKALDEGNIGKALLYLVALSGLKNKDAEVELNKACTRLVDTLKKHGTKEKELTMLVESLEL